MPGRISTPRKRTPTQIRIICHSAEMLKVMGISHRYGGLRHGKLNTHHQMNSCVVGVDTSLESKLDVLAGTCSLETCDITDAIHRSIRFDYINAVHLMRMKCVAWTYWYGAMRRNMETKIYVYINMQINVVQRQGIMVIIITILTMIECLQTVRIWI